uniref:Putative pectate lyase n=1 Tax=viral metagenome TaxID=1070528 RepID=A0A6M3KHK9_9ZZZZ
MAELIIYKSMLDGEVLEKKDVKNIRLSKVIYDQGRLMGKEVFVYVNNTLIHANDWYDYKLEESDTIHVVRKIEDPVTLGIGVGALVGGAMAYSAATVAIWYGVAWSTILASAAFWGTILKGALIGYALGSVLAGGKMPTAPENPALTYDTDVNYSWDGPKLVERPDGPVMVTYGEYLIGGNLIMKYISVGESSDVTRDQLAPNNVVCAPPDEGYQEQYKTVDSVSGSPTFGMGWSGYAANAIYAQTKIVSSPAIGSYVLAINPFVHPAPGWGSGNTINMVGTFSVLAGITYEVTFYSINYYEWAGVYIIWTDGNGATTFTSSVQPAGWQTWKRHSFTFTSQNTGASAKISIHFTANPDVGVWEDQHSIYVDGISIKKQYSSASTTYLNMLISLGEGPIKGIMKEDETGICTSINNMPYVKINNQFLSTYEGASWDYRLGTQTQSTIDGFHNTNVFYYDGSRLVKDTGYVYTTSGTDIDEAEIQLSCSSLFRAPSSGNIQSNKVEIKIEYAVAGSGSWVDLGNIDLEDKTKTKAYFSYKTGVLNNSPNQYDIRLTRQTDEFTADFYAGGDSYLEGITETTHEDIAYRNTALLALKIPASEQISGDISNVVVLIRGKEVKVPDLRLGGQRIAYDDCHWDLSASAYTKTSNASLVTDTGNLSATPQWTRNPIWCERDFILSQRYGLGEYYKKQHWDDDAAKSEAKYCWHRVDDLNASKEHRFHLDINISSFMSAEEMLTLLSQNFRGWTIWSGGKRKPIIDRHREPTMLFNVSNMKPASIKTTYLPSSKIPNMVEAQFANPDRDYTLETIEYINDAEWTAIKPQNKETLNLRGKIRRSEVLRNSKYFLNCAQLCNVLQEFDADIDAVRCEPGDTVQVQNDSLGWGQGGRVISATASSITVNKDIDVTASTQKIRVRLANGDLELKKIRNAPGLTRILNASGDFSSVPQADSIFAFGNPGADSKPFKVLNIKKESENTAKLTVIEESSQKYNDTLGVSLPEPKYSYLANPFAKPDAVIDLKGENLPNKPGLLISFHPPLKDPNWAYANIYIADTLSEMTSYLSVRSNVKGVEGKAGIEVMGLLPGKTYYIKVTSFNLYGKPGESSYIPVLLSWDNFIPPDVTGLRVKDRPGQVTFVGKDLELEWNKSSIVSGAGHISAGQDANGLGVWGQEIEYIYYLTVEIQGNLINYGTVGTPPITIGYSFFKGIFNFYGISKSSPITIKIWGLNRITQKKSTNFNSLTVTNTAPATPTGLAGTAIEDAVIFTWNQNPDSDIYGYRIRTRIDPPTGEGTWSDWSDILSAGYTRSLTIDEMVEQADGRSTINIDVKALDAYDNLSPTVSASLQCLNLKKEFIVSPVADEGHFQYIQEALNAVPADGWKIVLKQGTYDLSLETSIPNYSGGIQFPDHDITFEGINRGAVIIQNNDGDDGFILHNLTKTYSFSSFTFDAQVDTDDCSLIKIYGDAYTDFTGSVSVDSVDFLLDNSSHSPYGVEAAKISGSEISIRNCYFSSAATALLAYDEIYSTINFNENVANDCYFLVYANARTKLNIKGNVATECSYTAFYLSGTTGSFTVTGNHVSGTARWLLICEAAAQRCVISQNTFNTEYAGTSSCYGITTYGAYHTISGNIINMALANVTGDVKGISVYQTTDSNITGNSVYVDAPKTNGTHYGIMLTDSDRNNISSNNIDMVNSDPVDIGIYFDSDSDDNDGSDNITTNCGPGMGIVQG